MRRRVDKGVGELGREEEEEEGRRRKRSYFGMWAFIRRFVSSSASRV